MRSSSPLYSHQNITPYGLRAPPSVEAIAKVGSMPPKARPIPAQIQTRTERQNDGLYGTAAAVAAAAAAPPFPFSISLSISAGTGLPWFSFSFSSTAAAVSSSTINKSFSLRRCVCAQTMTATNAMATPAKRRPALPPPPCTPYVDAVPTQRAVPTPSGNARARPSIEMPEQRRILPAFQIAPPPIANPTDLP